MSSVLGIARRLLELSLDSASCQSTAMIHVYTGEHVYIDEIGQLAACYRVSTTCCTPNWDKRGADPTNRE